MPNPLVFHLHTFWRSSATYRVRVACRLKGISVEEQPLNLDHGAQGNPEYLRINPMGAVPALVVREVNAAPQVLTQSLAILEFLDELHPEPRILPTDLYGRARVRSLAGILVSDTHPITTLRVRDFLRTRAGFDDKAWGQWQAHWFDLGLQAMEDRLASDPETGRFCHGDYPTIADICLASIIVIQRILHLKTSDTPTVDRIMAACESVDAFRLAMPTKPPFSRGPKL